MESEKKGWWQQRTSLEKTLTASFCIAVIVALAFMITLIIVGVNSGDNNDGICLTPTCIQESSSVISNMNLAADPCDNFFEFACGTYLKETLIPDDKSTVSAFSIIDSKMKEQLRAIVIEPISDNEAMPFQNLKKFYQACYNTDTIETLGTSPITAVFNQQGNWPVTVQNWDESSWTWENAIAMASSFGYSPSYIFSFSISTDNKESTKRIIRIDQTSLGLAREYLIEGRTEPFVQAYHDYQIDLAMMMGATREAAETQMADALDFETKLAEISIRREDRRDAEALYNLRQISQLQADYDYLDWLSYFNSIMPEDTQLTSDDTVIVSVLSFFEDLRDIILTTPKRTIANYIMWRQAFSSVNYLPSTFRARQQEYNRLTTGSVTQKSRWLECVDTTLSFFPHSFGALYVRKHFNEEAKGKALEMVMNIKNEFNIILNDIDWMDDITKEAAIDKAERMKEQIGFADELLDDEKLTEYYDTFDATIDETKYYESVYGLTGWNVASAKRSRSRLREPIDKDEWSSEVTPAVVNAFYSSLENTIKFPAGILQGAFFNAERPQYMNYGGIGFVIGHEITHGFDDQGSLYDADGNLKNWWANSTRDAYLEKAKCIIEQYGNYLEPLTSLYVNGINTQGENIADNGGIKESYQAYVRWAKDNPEQKMPGLDYTPEQMFWISAGQIWCAVYREESMKSRVQTGVHSPSQFRVNGPMSNSEEFARDFSCPQGSNLNPVKKCAVCYLEPLTSLYVNGINTQGENIADNGGIKESYQAYVRWAKDNPEQKMPGLDYTPEQMFWISAGQIWCAVYREESMKSRVQTGVHSPSQFRVNGPMSNSEEFARDFSCPQGSNLNPEKKCAVWYFELLVAELREMLKTKGLNTVGNKQELVERLQSAVSESSSEILNEDDLLNDDELEDEKSLLESTNDTFKSPSVSVKSTSPESVIVPAKKVSLKRNISVSVPVIELKPDDEKETITFEESSNEPEKKVVKISELSSKDRLELRAKKFSITAPINDKDDRLQARAARFGISSTTSTTTPQTTTKNETDSLSLEKLKKRAERFGTVLVPELKKSEWQEKLQKRQERFDLYWFMFFVSQDRDHEKSYKRRNSRDEYEKSRRRYKDEDDDYCKKGGREERHYRDRRRHDDDNNLKSRRNKDRKSDDEEYSRTKKDEYRKRDDSEDEKSSRRTSHSSDHKKDKRRSVERRHNKSKSSRRERKRSRSRSQEKSSRRRRSSSSDSSKSTEINKNIQQPKESFTKKSSPIASSSSSPQKSPLISLVPAVQQPQPTAPSVELPAYYNPNVINVNKFAEQQKKRKLIWSGKKDEPVDATKWGAAKFSQDEDGTKASKFMRLMGIKDAPKVKEATAKPSDEMFSTMEQQYEVARQVTHISRGVGLVETMPARKLRRLGQIRNEFNDFAKMYEYAKAKHEFVKVKNSQEHFDEFIGNELQERFPQFDVKKMGWVTRNTRYEGKDNSKRLISVDLQHTGFRKTNCGVTMKIKTPYKAILEKSTDGVIWNVSGDLKRCTCEGAGNGSTLAEEPDSEDEQQAETAERSRDAAKLKELEASIKTAETKAAEMKASVLSLERRLEKAKQRTLEEEERAEDARARRVDLEKEKEASLFSLERRLEKANRLLEEAKQRTLEEKGRAEDARARRDAFEKEIVEMEKFYENAMGEAELALWSSQESIRYGVPSCWSRPF
ncbi:CLUMA_CG011204, isoform A [Clunio marinus]|uniref:CLUMA_CG011204, isoform A n=1 Tax=Clunio marinus TaxID=568069 RepID=A0A1J1IE45_9DIPT|nr:CLUMA_CG011204, isoform A [Clunio marinus]